MRIVAIIIIVIIITFLATDYYNFFQANSQKQRKYWGVFQNWKFYSSWNTGEAEGYFIK